MTPLHDIDPTQQRDWLKATAWLAGVCAAALIAFRIMGQLETGVSNLFFTELACDQIRTSWGGNLDAPRCGEFLLSFDPLWNYIRDIGLMLPRFVALGLVFWGIGLALRPHGRKSGELVPIAVGLSSFLIGPTILVNLIMKPGFGRPRPFWTTEFGDKFDYVLPGSFSNSCSGNCSFVSGEASAWFWMFWFIPFLPVSWRIKTTMLLAVPAIGFSFLRVVFGRHYVSDITMAAVISLLVIALCGWFFTSPAGQKCLAFFEKETKPAQ